MLGVYKPMMMERKKITLYFVKFLSSPKHFFFHYFSQEFTSNPTFGVFIRGSKFLKTFSHTLPIRFLLFFYMHLVCWVLVWFDVPLVFVLFFIW